MDEDTGLKPAARKGRAFDSRTRRFRRRRQIGMALRWNRSGPGPV